MDRDWVGEESGATTRGLPRSFTTVMLNEVKHLAGAGGRRILHFVQDDNWDGRGRARMVAMTTRGRPRLSIPVMLNEVKHLSGAGGRKILHFVQDDRHAWAAVGQ